MKPNGLEATTTLGLQRLAAEDPELYGMLDRECVRQADVLSMVAACSSADPSVLVCEGTPLTNLTTEGYPGARFHAGCEVGDQVERLAIERAKAVFGAQYANVQPHSGSSANGGIMFKLLSPNDTILGMDLDSGGHLTHGSKASVTGNYFRPIGYSVDADGLLEYDAIRALAIEHKPALIICGASAYPRVIDFERFRAIADEVGAYLLADISHIAGLVAGGVHPSPIDHAHFTTMSTYKQLYGPRGGLALMGRDADRPAPGGKISLSELVQRGFFPYFQGTPNLSAIAAKARALAFVARPEFKVLARSIVALAQSLASSFVKRGYRVLTGGTDNHMVVIDVLSRGVTGVVAEKALEECNVIINKNRIVGDKKSAMVTSGIRLGTNGLVSRGFGVDLMDECADLIDGVLSSIKPLNDKEYVLDAAARQNARARVAALCQRHPRAGYPS